MEPTLHQDLRRAQVHSLSHFLEHLLRRQYVSFGMARRPVECAERAS